MNKIKTMLIIGAAFAVADFAAGCRYVRVTNNGAGKGWEVKYNSHWLDTKTDSLEAEIQTNGTIRVALGGLNTGPSPELAHFMDVTLAGAANLATKVGAAIATCGGSASADAVAGMVKSFVARGGDAAKATVTCADGNCTITDGTVSETCVGCVVP